MKPYLAKIAALHTCCNPFFQDFVLLFLRITIGWTFFLSGKGKLVNFDRTTSFFADLNIPAPAFNAGLVGYTEMVGGLLLVAGLGTRLASIPLIITMVVAYLTEDLKKVFSSISKFTDQAPFIFLCVTLVTLAFGPGRASLDAVIGRFCKCCKS